MMPRDSKAVLLFLVLLTSCGSARPQEEPRWRELREKMVRQTIAEPTDGRPAVRDPRVLAAMRSIPRHEFVPADERSQAYEDHPLRIGHGQTISQPYIVAIMTELAALKPEHRVLEVGTGSGYQAAVLSPLVKEVYTIEIVRPLGESARERLARLGYKNVEVRVGDGYNGWPEKAPFDAIVVTAGAPHVPPALVEQLKPGGRMVIPLGESSYDQNLVVVHRGKRPRDFRTETIMPVRFVPLTREPKPE
ncbi:MAG TPA: protein-L-isoaspartate(D-aspartate) O-methyltransferase [Candidatus Acidoferrales bacterium]|nr:protein-L-isoaspartate(D-aspartate) O-methyltransferase [Candidatus Acidoferrales bacterium]